MAYQINSTQMSKLNEKGIFNILNNNHSGTAQIQGRTMDGGLSALTPFNTAMPAGLLTSISPKMVDIILRERTAEKVIGGKDKLLEWEQENIIIPIVEKVGETKPYSDFDNAPATGTNATFVYRGHHRYSTAVQVGRLQSMQMSSARVSLEQTNMDAALESLAITFNNIAFNGYGDPNGKYPIKGILTDDTLPPIKATTFKKDGTATFKQVYDDIRNAIQELIIQSGNHLNLLSPFRVCMANSVFMMLTEINELGTTPVADALKAVIPNISFEMIPEFEKAHSNTNDVFYIIGENSVGGVAVTGDLGFSELALSSNTVAYENHTSQILSSGTVGAVFYKPYNVVRRYIPNS